MPEHTSGMLALIPDNATELAVAGGEDPDQLHLTLLYLGDDVAGWPDGQAERLRELITASAPGLDAVSARIMGHAVFNPDGYDDRDPCQVYLVGDTPDLEPLRRWAHWVMESGEDYASPPPQHTPFLPHVTAKVGRGAHLTYAGPVRFGTLRLALGDTVLDVALGDQEAGMAVSAKSITFTPPQAICDYAHTETVWRDDPVATAVVEGKALDGNGLAWVAANCGEIGRSWAMDMLGRIEVKTDAADVEVKVMSPDPRAAKLRKYWAHGVGRKKWHNFRSLRRQLGKYVKSPRILNGLTANVFKLAEGIYPGQRPHGGRKEIVDQESVEVKDLGSEGESALCEGIDDWGATFADEDVSEYADDLTDDDHGEKSDDPALEIKRFAAIGATLVADPGPVVEEALAGATAESTDQSEPESNDGAETGLFDASVTA